MSTRKVAIAGAVPLLAAGLFASLPAGAASAASARATVHGTRPSWATASQDRGAAPGSNRVDLRVWLSMRDPAGLSQLVAAVSDPSSPQYGQRLTPAQFDATYAPTATQADAVASWLRSAGLSVGAVPSTDRYVSASGSVAQVEKAFGVALHDYAVKGNVWRAPAGDPSVPASLATTVLTITGLDNGDHAMRPASQGGTIAPPPAYENAPPMSTYYGQLSSENAVPNEAPAMPAYDGSYLPYVVKGYTPPDLRSAYGTGSLDGSGTTVAIVDAYWSSTIVSDANAYRLAHDSTSPKLVEGQNFSQSLPNAFTYNGVCGASGWQGEETLDVEAVHGLAPGADIAYYGASSCQDKDLLDALTRVVQDGTANVISNSWSGYESQTTAGLAREYESVFQQAIAEGMTVAFSSGDDGDELAATGTKQVDYPSSDPYVTSVGGTGAGIAGGAFVGQDGWGTGRASLDTTTNSWGSPSFFYGSGGGCSAMFAEPEYQRSATGANVVSDCAGSLIGGGTGRGVPDVSMLADPNTGYLVGETQKFPHNKIAYGEYRIGGTSLACPLFSALLALAEQSAGKLFPQANTALYQLPSKAITDILPHGGSGTLPDAGNVRADYANGLDASSGIVYSVRVFGQDSSLPVTSGWDQVTGLGSLDGATISALAGTGTTKHGKP